MGKTAALVVLVIAFAVGLPGRATAAPLGEHEDGQSKVPGARRAAAADWLLRTATAPEHPEQPASPAPSGDDVALTPLPDGGGGAATAQRPVAFVAGAAAAAAAAAKAATAAAPAAMAAAVTTAAATAATPAVTTAANDPPASPPVAPAVVVAASGARLVLAAEAHVVPGEEHLVEGENAAVLAPALQIEADATGNRGAAVLGEQYERPSADASSRARRGPGAVAGLARTGATGSTDDLLALGLGLVAIGSLLTRTSRARRGPARSRQAPGRGSTPLTPGRTSERGRSRLH